MEGTANNVTPIVHRHVLQPSFCRKSEKVQFFVRTILKFVGRNVSVNLNVILVGFKFGVKDVLANFLRNF